MPIRRLAPLLALLVVLAPSGSVRAGSARARVLADNPPLALLVGAVGIRLQLVSCDSFGQFDSDECMRRMDSKDIGALVDLLDRRSTKTERTYCVSYNRPMVGSRRHAPISGFKCWFDSSGETSSWGTLEFSCSDSSGSRSCRLTHTAGNEDEDEERSYAFELTGKGRDLEIAGDTVTFSFMQKN